MSQTKAQLISDLVQALNFTGTASAPANGLFLSAANTLALATNSAQRLTIDSSGKVGIGTTSPAALLNLDVDTEANLGSGSEGIRLTSGSSNAQLVRLGSSYSNNSVTGPGTLLYSSNKLSIRCDNSNPITFHTGSTVAERMRIDSSGRVGIGQSTNLGSYDSSSDRLVVGDGSADEGITIVSGQSVGHHGSIFFADGTGSTNSKRGQIRYEQNTEAMKFATAGSERLRIDINGNVLVGLSSTLSSNNAKLQVAHTDGNADIIVHRAGNNANPPSLNFQKTRNTSIGNYGTIVQDDDELGSIRWGGADGSAIAFAARIVGAVDGTPGANDMPGRIQFHTSADGSEGMTERMRIDSSGNVGIGTTSPAQLLEIHGASNPAILLKDTTNNVLSYLYSQDLVGAVGTASNHPFVFNVNNGEKMRITSAGLVGIGTTSPSTTLHLDSSGTPTTIQIDSDTESSIDFNDHGGSAKRYKVGTNISSNDGQLEIKDITANVERVRIDTDGHVIAAKSIVSENLPGRNIIINGDMRVAQRATSASMSNAGNTYDVCDRWAYNRNGVTGTLAQVDEVPDGSGFRKSLKLTTTSAVGSIAAGNMISFAYYVEGQDIRRLGYGNSDAKTATVSFWVRGSLSGKIGVNCSRDSRTFSANEDIVADTWKFVEIVIPADTSTGFSAADNANGFNLAIRFAAGSNFTSGTTGGNWINFHTAYAAGFTAGQQGAYLTTNGSTMQVTGVQLEIGSKATPFDHKCFTEQLQKCKRYYYKSMEYGVPTTQPIALASNSTTVDLDGFNGWIFHSTTSCRSPIFDHPVEMRALPTVQIYSSGRVAGQSTNDVLAVYDGSAWVNCSSNSPRHNTRKIAFLGTVSSALTQFGAFLFGGGYDCDAEL